MPNYGMDFRLDENRDIVFTVSGDAEVVGGPALVAQDIREELSIALGSVEWDVQAGSDLAGALNSAQKQDDWIMSELGRCALKDGRVDAASVQTKKLAYGRFELSFRVLGVMRRNVLLFDLEGIYGGGQ